MNGHVVVPHNPTIIKTVKSRKFKNIGIDMFMRDFNMDDIARSDINDAVSALDTELLRVLHKQAPLKEIRVSDRKRQVWYNDHIKEQMKVKRNREFIWKK